MKREIFESIEHELQAVPGAVDFVVWARSRYRIALATSATPRNRDVALKMLGIGDCFEVIVDHGRSPRPKPDPEVFLMAMRDLGVQPRECWIIEDSLNGIMAAKAAGCVTVGITTTFDAGRLSDAGADVVVGTFVELRRVLELHKELEPRRTRSITKDFSFVCLRLFVPRCGFLDFTSHGTR